VSGDILSVRDLRTGRDLGRPGTWTSTSDAAGGLVFVLTK